MILNKLTDYAILRVEEAKKYIGLEEIKERALSEPKGNFLFEKSLRKQELAFICEVKKASPSKGIIDAKFDYIKIAKEYEEIGADCVSCLTEPKWFLGSDNIFRDIRKNIKLPMLRKDFTVDEYQLYESKCMGANAVLLICAVLDTKTIERYLEICNTLGLSALVETHDEQEVKSAIKAGAKIIGVNNRNLKDFSVDMTNSSKLRELVPSELIFVAESGIKEASDITALRDSGVDAVLIGEALMRAPDKHAKIREYREASA